MQKCIFHFMIHRKGSLSGNYVPKYVIYIMNNLLDVQVL